jgi:hypothetical protein
MCATVQAREVGTINGTVEKVTDRSIVINGSRYQPSGYATLLPNWVKPGTLATISYACDELGDCFYIDVVSLNGTTPIGDKINSNLLEFKNIFRP